MGDRQGEAYTLNDMGAAATDSGSLVDALNSYEKALRIFQETGNRLGEASARHNIGYAYALAGDMEKALDSYKQARSIRRAEQDRRGEIMTINAMSGAYDGLGEPGEAVKLAEEAAGVWREKNEPVNEAIATINAAQIYDEWGDWQKALDYYRHALALLPPLKSFGAEDCGAAGVTNRCRAEAAVFDSMGATYAAIGEPQRALELHEKALPIRLALRQPRNIGITLARIGYAYFLQDEPENALRKFSEALPILQQVGDKRSQAYTLTLLGMLHAARKEYSEALVRYHEALRIQQELKDFQGQAITLDKMGQAYALSDKATEAFKHYEQALELWRRFNDPHGEALTLFNVARTEQKLGRITQAHEHVQLALSKIESLRTNITSQKLRTSYFTTKQNYYELQISLLMQMHAADGTAGHDLAALAVNERARARGLIDILAEAHVDIREGIAPELIKQEQSLRQRLADKLAAARKLTTLDERLTRERRSVALAKEINDLIVQHDEVKAHLRRRSPRYAELKQPRILGVEEIRQLLDDDTLLLEYTLGEEHSYLWAVSKAEKTRSYVLPKRTEIEAAARHLYTLLTGPEPLAKELPSQRSARTAETLVQYREASATLSRMLLGPVAERLGKKRLLIVSDGALQYLPFGALPIPAAGVVEKTPPGRPVDDSAVVNSLLAEHDIVELPSASTLVFLRNMKDRRKPARHWAAIFADPVFTPDDSRIENAKSGRPSAFARLTTNVNSLRTALRDSVPSDSAGISRLPFTRLEARAIMSVIPRGEGLEAIDFDASYETATNAKISNYRIIHFATHGLLDAVHPELSGLVLSQFDRQGRPTKYGFLRLSDIYNLKLGADLVVLSACRTGLGKEVKGEGLIGLTRGFMYAGASRVVASLWKVDDEATSELMKSFYQYMLVKRMPPVTALREAQKDIARQTRWRHPYYWAAFVLQGDWK
jgi:CHAT domain-containing protein/tetratricopeptide (TPR) repeat protein